MNWHKHIITGKIAHLVVDAKTSFEAHLKNSLHSEKEINERLYDLMHHRCLLYEAVRTSHEKMPFVVTWSGKSNGSFLEHTGEGISLDELKNWSPIEHNEDFIKNFRTIENTLSEEVYMAKNIDCAESLKKCYKHIDVTSEQFWRGVIREDRVNCYMWLTTVEPEIFDYNIPATSTKILKRVREMKTNSI
jgi:hypothetical protein